MTVNKINIFMKSKCKKCWKPQKFTSSSGEFSTWGRV